MHQYNILCHKCVESPLHSCSWLWSRAPRMCGISRWCGADGGGGGGGDGGGPGLPKEAAEGGTGDGGREGGVFTLAVKVRPKESARKF